MRADKMLNGLEAYATEDEALSEERLDETELESEEWIAKLDEEPRAIQIDALSNWLHKVFSQKIPDDNFMAREGIGV